jgi:uncharacterized protein (TIGR03435 family)
VKLNFANWQGNKVPLKTARTATTILIVGFGFLQSVRAGAQVQPHDAQPKLPEFEVASVRPSDPGQRELNGFYTYPGGRIVGRGCRLEYLVMVAFSVQQFQISGSPGWTNLVTGDAFDIQAKPPDSSPSAQWNPASPKSAPGEEERQMLQSLLADRFKLQFHRVVKKGPVYVLTRRSSTLKLYAPKDKAEFPWAGGITGGWFGGGMRGENISMPQLATRLSRFLNRPVLDQTGLEGSFDFEYQNGSDDNDTDIAGFLLTAMKGIGLNLKSAKGPVDVFIIDHVEKPSEN